MARGTLKTGGVTVIQRSGSALNLNVHFHTLMIDGVYQIAPSGAALFHPVPAPTDDDVASVVEQVCRKIARMLDARGDDENAGLASADPCSRHSQAPRWPVWRPPGRGAE